MSKKQALLALLAAGHEELQRYAVSLDESQRKTSGTADEWAARDVLPHCAYWQQETARRIGVARARGIPDPEGHFDSINRQVFAEYAARPWSDYEQLLESAQAALLEQVQALTEEDLDGRGDVTWLEGAPLWRGIASNAFMHPAAHLRPIYQARGDRDALLRISELEFEHARQLDDSPAWQGMIRYNLGCAYALLGEQAIALGHLEAGLRQSPGIVEWAEQDSDLASLHGTPQFTEMLARLKAA